MVHARLLHTHERNLELDEGSSCETYSGGQKKRFGQSGELDCILTKWSGRTIGGAFDDKSKMLASKDPVKKLQEGRNDGTNFQKLDRWEGHVRSASQKSSDRCFGIGRKTSLTRCREQRERAHALTHMARESGPPAAIRVCFDEGVSAKDAKRVKHRSERRVALASGSLLDGQ